MAESRRIVTEEEIWRFQQLLSGFEMYEVGMMYGYFRSDLEHLVSSWGSRPLLSEMSSRIKLDSQKYISMEKELGTSGFCTIFFQDICDMEPEVMMGLWESLFVLQKDHPHPNLLGMMAEITYRGHLLVPQILLDQSGHELDHSIKEIQSSHKQNLLQKTEKMVEYRAPGSSQTPQSFYISERYLDLRVVASHKFRRQCQHELIEVGGKHEIYMCKKQSGLEHISLNKLFRWCHRSGSVPHAVIVSGVPGVGKTTLMQKFVYDWINKKHYQRFSFVFLFKFRDLNNSEKVRLESMILNEYPYLRGRLRDILKEPEKLLFIFDGLDESAQDIDFTSNQLSTNTQHIQDLGVIVVSLVRQTLLKGCSVLITSRPTRLTAVDVSVFGRVLEIMGFFPEERERYFMKSFTEVQLAEKAFNYVRQNDALYTFCYIPSYCWIICKVLSMCFRANPPSCEPQFLPKTVTQLFVTFISHIMSNHSQNKAHALDFLKSIGRLAEYGVLNQILSFDSRHLSSFKVDPKSQLLSSFLVESSQPSGVTYTFIHLTIQEFMAALPHFMDYSSEKMQALLEKANSFPDGRGEMLLRFLIGLSDKSTRTDLRPYLNESSDKASRHVIGWLSQFVPLVLREEGDYEDKRKLLNIFSFLFESRNKELVSQLFGLNMRFDLTEHHLTPLDCTLLTFILEACKEVESLDLDTCYIHSEGLQRLAPILPKLKNLRLANNDLKDEDMNILNTILTADGCQITQLSLRNNSFTQESCTHLACALSSNRSLRELDLSRNNMAGPHFEHLVTALSNRNCGITHLYLQQTKLRDEHATTLLPLSRIPNLASLDLSQNYFQDPSCDVISNLIMTSTGLREIRIDGNYFSDDQKTHLKCLEAHKPVKVTTC